MKTIAIDIQAVGFGLLVVGIAALDVVRSSAHTEDELQRERSMEAARRQSFGRVLRRFSTQKEFSWVSEYRLRYPRGIWVIPILLVSLGLTTMVVGFLVAALG